MQYIKNWWYDDQYYKITKEGDQKSMFNSCPYVYILHIHKTKSFMQYHFLKSGDSYQIHSPYSVLGMSIIMNNHCYVLPPQSFLLKGNELGEIVMQWLCKHYFYRRPSIGEWTILDDQIQLHKGHYIKVNNELKNDIK
jgi:hypothetical protein